MNESTSNDIEHFDTIVIGAGVAGLYFHYRLRELGLKVRGFEAGSGVGGTWYWNRYPGARFDSESYSYGYSFSQELLDEWEWSEHFSGQPENERYLNYVADKFDLRRDIQFSTRVASAAFNTADRTWLVKTENGQAASARFLIQATGVLSAPYVPTIEGADIYQGETWHTSTWPRDPVDLSDKRVGVIGTGATAVQMITEISKNISDLTVFQRTPNYAKPLFNSKITPEEQIKIKASYPDIFARCNSTFGGFLHDFDERLTFDVSEEERLEFYERTWNEKGFAFWLGCFSDILTDPAANEPVAEFVRNKIRERVNDPEVAELLAPKCHPFGTKRQPMESGYYEAYNRDNVHLIDLHKTPIERFTKKGLATSDKEYEFDIVIYATGFDAVTGALTRIDIRGENGVVLKDRWHESPSAYLGMSTVGFPNMFITGGPHNSSSFCNIPRCLEQNVEWITDCIAYMREHGHTRIEANQDAEDAWTDFVLKSADETLLTNVDNWFMGSNIPGKKRIFLNYVGGVPLFRERCDESAANGYSGFTLA
jgi:cation diffusion facilitator CzcD-associated flavoprotein CzcO